MHLNHIEKIRGFNRFYTQVLGLLDHKLLKSEFSLAEARILFELAQGKDLVSSDLARQLRMDPAYLSRILTRFQKKGLLLKKKSPQDTRKQVLHLTSSGRSELYRLQEMSNLQINSSLTHTTREDHDRLIRAMDTIQQIFTGESPEAPMFTLRSHRPGDLGYITYRHALFYSRAYGFDATFDAYVAEGLSEFVTRYNPEKEHLWVAEQDMETIGSIAIVDTGENAAQLRWFLIEPESRGKGLGKKLLGEAVEFSRRKNYEKIILWTISNLEVARQLYRRFGFRPSETQTHQIWGQELTEELWELELA
ncbi:bifunctional helix-turn-helix transcriptional regulator/GNAT family N-acetyltransferase [Desulfospira joergensenii]|uniref:bifunctional helix-turn-helix transcriptional regulator/GNAT family N-acetyltransferase n=1 Tax=Desulfospira joergensenii TaxID=53329 RepID=UPI0003B4CF31|nr:bifunctional helix-turn-helix transcriptional regulator/GNAT family N-acetyltransferase [Desulfospira joergensenii]